MGNAQSQQQQQQQQPCEKCGMFHDVLPGFVSDEERDKTRREFEKTYIRAMTRDDPKASVLVEDYCDPCVIRWSDIQALTFRWREEKCCERICTLEFFLRGRQETLLRTFHLGPSSTIITASASSVSRTVVVTGGSSTTTTTTLATEDAEDGEEDGYDTNED